MRQRELYQREHAIEAQRVRADLEVGRALILRDKCVLADQSTDQPRAGGELWQEGPGKILVRVAGMDQLPVEDRSDAAMRLEEIAEPVVAMDDAHAGRGLQVATQPQQRPDQHRIWLQRPA